MKRAVLLMSYGSPSNRDDVERYYTHIMRGRAPEPAQLEELLGRYDAIGGGSPLTAITYAQADALERRWRQEPSANFTRVYVGFKHAEPFISQAVDQMAADGVEEAVGLVLAPHYSALSVGVYVHEAKERSDELGLRIRFVNDWYQQSSLNQALALRLQESLKAMGDQGKVKVLFSAHSLPERIVAMNDPYPHQLQEHSEMLASQVGVADWQFAWQSAGRTREPWLGPDILKVLPLLKEEGYDGVVSCPIGFIADHLEVLYDLDVEATKFCNDLGLRFTRTRSLNDDPLLIDALYQALLA